MKNILLFICIILISCGSSQQEKKSGKAALNDSLKNVIMHVHDEAMKQSGYILKLKRTINQIKDNSNNKDSFEIYTQKSVLLYKADQLMLNWMHQYREPVNLESDSVQTYLLLQKQLIDTVYFYTFKSIHEAEVIINR